MSGYALGQYNVGVQYFSGKGVELDYAKAVEFYEKAAKQGFAPAQVLNLFPKPLSKKSKRGGQGSSLPWAPGYLHRAHKYIKLFDTWARDSFAPSTSWQP